MSRAMGGCEVTLISDEEAPQAGRLGEEAGAILADYERGRELVESGARLQ